MHQNKKDLHIESVIDLNVCGVRQQWRNVLPYRVDSLSILSLGSWDQDKAFPEDEKMNELIIY